MYSRQTSCALSDIHIFCSHQSTTYPNFHTSSAIELINLILVYHSVIPKSGNKQGHRHELDVPTGSIFRQAELDYMAKPLSPVKNVINWIRDSNFVLSSVMHSRY